MSINKKTLETFISRNGIIFKGTAETIDDMIRKSKKLTKELADAGRYEKVDDILIESMVMCVDVQHLAYWDIKEHGVSVFVDAAKLVKQKNHSISTLMQMNKNILDLSARLGMSPLDRHNLKIELPKADGLDD